MIKTVILDIGNVLACFGWKDYLTECGYDKELFDRISASTVYSDAWKEWDRGSISRDEMANICSQYDNSIEQEIRKFFEHIYNTVREYEYSEAFVKQLKDNGYQVYLLSNFNGGHYEYCKENLRFLKYVDGGVISYEVNHVKPEPQIYQILLDKYNINPSSAVFLDDMEENLEAAKSFGLHTVLVKSHVQALDHLRSFGVVI